MKLQDIELKLMNIWKSIVRNNVKGVSISQHIYLIRYLETFKETDDKLMTN